MKTKLALSGLLVLGILSSGVAIAVPTYSFTDLGVLTGVSGLNDVGQVIGFRNDSNNVEHGFVYSSGGMSDLGATIRPTSINNSGQMSGTIPSSVGWGVQGYFSNGIGAGWTNIGGLGGFGRTEASMINEDGAVLGFSYDTGAYVPQAFLLTDTGLASIGSLGGSSVKGRDINGAGVISGVATNSSGKSHAFIFDMNGMHDLGTLGGNFSSSNALNEFGQIAGYGYTANGIKHAATNSDAGLVDLGTLGGSASEALAINNKGQLVGWSDTVGGYGNSHAFIFDSSTMVDLGTLGGKSSSAIDINDEGDVIGWSTITAYGDRAAFLYSYGEMINLETLIPGFTNIDTSSLFLNEIGQIAGVGQVNGKRHGFLLGPVLYVPEPGSYQLILLGIFLLSVVFSRKSNSAD